MSCAERILIVIQIQYSSVRSGQPYAATATYLGDAKGTRFVQKCTGIKRCEFLADELASLQVTELTEEKLELICQVRQRTVKRATKCNIRATKAYYDAAVRAFDAGQYCPDQGDDCKLAVFESATMV